MPSSQKKTSGKKRSRSSTSRTRPPQSPPVGGTGSEFSPTSPETDPLGLVGEPFRPLQRDRPPAAKTLTDIDQPEFRPPPPEPVQWDPEKAKTVLTGLGMFLHHLDPAGRSPHAEELWKLTEDDLAAIAPPASRIANRYATARTISGYSDEAGVLLAAGPFVKRNLALRGRAKTLDALDDARLNDAHRDRYEPEPARAAEPEPRSQPDSQPEQPARRQPEIQPEIIDVREAAEPAGPGLADDEDPRPAADWFEFWPGAGAVG